MVSAGYICHNPNRAADAGQGVPTWLRVGENVGVGPSTTSVQNAFLASPPHHANIDNQYNLIGMGTVAAADRRMYFTQAYALAGGAPPPPPPPPAAWSPPPPPPPPPAPAVRCRRRGRRVVCARARRARAGRRARGGRRRSRVRGVELVRPERGQGADARSSEVTLPRAMVGMLSRAGDKVTFWD